MKISALVLVYIVANLVAPAHAEPKWRRAETPATTANQSYPSEYRSLSSSDQRMLVGVASDSAITRSTTPALTMWLDLSPTMSLQAYTMIGSVDPFNFAIGGNVKFTLMGTTSKGF